VTIEAKWTQVKTGKRIMHALAFMRVEKTTSGWRAWDVMRAPLVRAMVPTTTHRTLAEAKTHCEKAVAAPSSDRENAITGDGPLNRCDVDSAQDRVRDVLSPLPMTPEQDAATFNRLAFNRIAK